MTKTQDNPIVMLSFVMRARGTPDETLAFADALAGAMGDVHWRVDTIDPKALPVLLDGWIRGKVSPLALVEKNEGQEQ
jgi:hypothetical protein